MAKVKIGLVGLLLIVAGCSADPAPVPTPAGATQSTSTSGWELTKDPSAAAAKAGLSMLDREMLQVHYHAHLEVIARGAAIPVPGNIGIDVARHRISPLHTHDTTGIVHIESAEDIPFTLWQVFTEWGQPLSAQQLGPLTAGAQEQIRVYRNGMLQQGDPAALKLQAHDQIVVWLGPAGEQPSVNATYVFPSGL